MLVNGESYKELTMEPTINQINLEVLKIAKELVENQYLDYRAKVHNKWLTDSERLWDTEQSKMDYPEINPYPTEEDIVARAQVLLDFLNKSSGSSPDVVSSTETTETTSNVKVDSSKVEDTTTSQPKQLRKPKVPLPPEDNKEWAKAKVNRYDQEHESAISRVIPELMKALNQPRIV